MSEFVSCAGLRTDGRRPHEIRRIRTRMGVFSKVDGSVYLEQGNTKVCAIVYGPRERTSSRRSTEIDKISDDRARIHCVFSQAEFSTSDRKTYRSGDRKQMEYALALKQTFEGAIMTHLYPRTEIHVSVEVLHADGGILAASINAVTLALIDAGISVRDYVIASTAGLVEQDTFLTDLNTSEENSMCPILTIAIMPRNERISLTQMEAKIPLSTFESMLKTATAGCHEVATELRNVVEENTWRQLASKDI